MDWVTVLRSLQYDFIKRLKAGCLLHCETQGQYSELTIISGERLNKLREFCWQMAEKYKRTSPVRDVFLNNLKGKLGEEVVKERLADFVTEVDYEKRFGGDGKIDFTLTYNSSIGVEVKSRHGTVDRIRWSISVEEVEKNAVVVCILIQEEVNEAQREYHLFLAGFLPTKMIKLKTGKISFGIEQLLYGGGLQCYLEELQSLEAQKFNEIKNNPLVSSKINNQSQEHFIHHGHLNILYLKIGDECLQQRQFNDAITAYNQALLKDENANTYYKRGFAHYNLENYQEAIADYIQAIRINPNYAKAYHQLGLVRYQIKDYEGAVADFTEVIRINPNDALAYRNRAGIRYFLKDHQGSIEDYTQAIKINPQIDDANFHIIASKEELTSFEQNLAQINDYYNLGNTNYTQGNYQEAIIDYTQAIKVNYNDADAYFQRGNVYYHQGNKQKANEDFQKAADLYQKAGKLAEHKKAREKILDLEIEESLDILNF